MVAINAPMPRPVKNRKMPNVVVSCISAVIAMPMEKVA